MTTHGEHPDPGAEASFSSDADPTMYEANPEEGIKLSAVMLSEGRIMDDDLPRGPELNEDVAIADSEAGFFLVSDGAGGHAGGKLAAETVAQAIKDRMHPVDFSDDFTNGDRYPEEFMTSMMTAATTHAEKQIRALTDNKDRVHGAPMATLVAGQFYTSESGQDMLAVMNIGDSRLYRLRNGEAVAMTEDQSRGNILLNSFIADERSPRGGDDQYLHLVVEPGDRYMLCSDGVTGDIKEQILSDAELAEALSTDNDPDTALRNVVALSRKNDDTTAIIIDVAGGEAPISQAEQQDSEPANAETAQPSKTIGVEVLGNEYGVRVGAAEVQGIYNAMNAAMDNLGGKDGLGAGYEKAVSHNMSIIIDHVMPDGTDEGTEDVFEQAITPDVGLDVFIEERAGNRDIKELLAYALTKQFINDGAIDGTVHRVQTPEGARTVHQYAKGEFRFAYTPTEKI